MSLNIIDKEWANFISSKFDDDDISDDEDIIDNFNELNKISQIRSFLLNKTSNNTNFLFYNSDNIEKPEPPEKYPHLYDTALDPPCCEHP